MKKQANILFPIKYFFNRSFRVTSLPLRVFIAFLISFLIHSFLFPEKSQRIITIDGPITETAFALGGNGKVIAVDDTSFFPKEVFKLPRVGYIRSLNAEGILAMKPTLILTSDGIKPPNVLTQLQAAGVRVEIFSSKPSLKNTYDRIDRISEAIESRAKGTALKEEIQSSLDKLKKKLKSVKTTPSVLFILNIQGKQAMVAGKGTRPDFMIDFVGGKPVSRFKQWKLVSSESAIKLNPDIILCMKSHGENKDTEKEIYKNEGLKLTKAVKNKKVFVVDYAYYFHMGPRLADAAWDLANILHGDSL